MTAAERVVTADVRLENVVKVFDGTTAVDGISLEVPRGSFFALLGPSGCGKTTTLRMIGGFEEPTEGRILLGDRDVVGLPPYKRDVNTVFQSYALFPHMSISENVAFGLERKRVAKGEVKGRVVEILGLGVPFVIGAGFLLLGLVVLIVWRLAGNERFFGRKPFEAVDPAVARADK